MGDFYLEDFYFKIKDALENKTIERLIKEYNGDSTLKYSISEKLVGIKRDAFYKNRLKDSIEKVFNMSKGVFEYIQENKESGIFTAIEVPFTSIFDKEKLEFYEILIGKRGDKNMCYWEDGTLLEESHKKTKGLNLKISLGHTHPVIIPEKDGKREYGAIPSWIPYSTKEGVERFVKDKKAAQRMIESEIHKKYGADYCEILIRSKEKEVSSFSMIMSAALNQLGIFEIKEKGQIIYHPWKIIL